jgi:hypothetical protein
MRTTRRANAPDDEFEPATLFVTWVEFSALLKPALKKPSGGNANWVAVAGELGLLDRVFGFQIANVVREIDARNECVHLVPSTTKPEVRYVPRHRKEVAFDTKGTGSP